MNTSRSFSRRTLLRTAIGAAGTLAIAGAVPFQEAFALDGATGTVNTSGVRLRSGAGTGASVIGVLPNGAKVTQQGSNATQANGYSWITVKVTATGTVGWIASEFVTFGNGSQEPGGSSGQPSATYPQGTAIIVTSGPLRIRQQPNGTILTSAATGTTGISQGTFQQAGGYTWLSVSMASVKGWVVIDFIGKASGGAPTTPSPTPAPGAGWPVGTAVYVDANVLNLRSAASATASVVGFYKYGTAAQIVGSPVSADGYTWYKVKITSSGAIGYMIGEGLAKGTASESPSASRIVVVDGPVKLRSKAGLAGSVIESVKQGTGADIWSASMPSADGYTWVQVRVDGTKSIGWVATAFVDFV